jgi:two-component system cell cycle response regulator
MSETTLTTREPIPNSLTLPSLPHIAARILHLTRGPSAAAGSVREIAECLSQDPALVQRILRVVNSPLYGLTGKVRTVTQAASFLGGNALRGLVLGFTLPRTWEAGRGTGFSMVTFWRYSLTTAVAAKLLAAQTGHKDPEEAFVVGLLADIGVLALYRTVPGEYETVLALRQKRLSGLDLSADPLAAVSVMCDAEQEALGTDHARIGSQMLSHGGLAEDLTLPIRYHHAPETMESPAPPVLTMTLLVHVAAVVSQTLQIGGKRTSMAALEALGGKYLGLRKGDAGGLVDAITESVKKTAELLEINIGRQPSLSEILQQANEELANLTLAADQAAREEARVKDEAQRRTRELEGLTWELANRANRDPLTGVFNRGFFNTCLEHEFERGKSTNRPMALVLTDVHHFKEINDTFGHQQGDAVITALAQRLQGATRNNDIVARYGGDEFAVVLPDIDFPALQAVAAKILGAVWDQPFPAPDGGKTLPVTMGVGAVWVQDYSRLQGTKHLIESADKLLYASKRERKRMIFLART